MSPQNSATITTSRNPADTKKLKAVKFSPPLVAAVTSPGVPFPPDAGPLISKAPTSTHGRTIRMEYAMSVRRRLN